MLSFHLIANIINPSYPHPNSSKLLSNSKLIRVFLWTHFAFFNNQPYILNSQFLLFYYSNFISIHLFLLLRKFCK